MEWTALSGENPLGSVHDLIVAPSRPWGDQANREELSLTRQEARPVTQGGCRPIRQKIIIGECHPVLKAFFSLGPDL
jgi:hypothetical protein